MIILSATVFKIVVLVSYWRKREFFVLLLYYNTYSICGYLIYTLSDMLSQGKLFKTIDFKLHIKTKTNREREREREMS